MKWIQNILLGCLIGLSTSYITITITTLLDGTQLWTGADLLEEVLLALAIGAIIGAATLLFKIEHWSYRFILLVHFAIVVTCVYSAGAIGGWYEKNALSIFYLFCEIVFIYIIVWIIMLLLEKKEIERMNTYLKRK